MVRYITPEKLQLYTLYATPFYSIELNFYTAKFHTFSSIEKRHHQTEDLHEGRHLMRDWWEISMLFTNPS